MRSRWTMGPLSLLLVPMMALCVQRANSGTPNPNLINGAFDADIPGQLSGWQLRGEKFGHARRVDSPVSSRPYSLELEAIGKGSTGNESAMVYQILDPTPFRGRKLELRAAVQTSGLGVNLLLYTPQGTANDFFQDLQSGRFVTRTASLTVPENASMLWVGIQIFGPAGGRAWVDDVTLLLDGVQLGSDPETTAGEAGGTPQGVGPSGSSSVVARMRVDARRPLRDIDPALFCMHIEWVEHGNGLLDERTDDLRASVLDLLVPLRIGAFRFPGGIHADFYDWRLGTGPRGSRGEGRHAFKKNRETQHFGSEELLKLLDRTGAEACITANYGTGTAKQAGAWAQFFAGTKHQPRYWEVGNEIYLSDADSDGANSKEIFHTGKEYAGDFQKFRSAIRAALPNAQVGMIGHLDNGAFPLAPAKNRNWTQDMLGALEGRADFMAVHNAYAPVIIDDSVRFTEKAQRDDAYRAVYAAAQQTAENFDLLSQTIERLSPQNAGIPMAVTEFGPFFGMSGRQDLHIDYVDQSRTLAAAIYTASVLDVFIGDSRVFMSCYTNPIHRWYGSLITDTDDGLITTPTYYVYQLYRSRFESRLLHSELDGPSFDSPQVGIVAARRGSPTVMGQASLSRDGRRLTAMLISRAIEGSVPFTLEVGGFTSGTADCRLLGGGEGNYRNGPALGKSTQQFTPSLKPRTVSCAFDGSSLQIDLPAQSVLSIVITR